MMKHSVFVQSGIGATLLAGFFLLVFFFGVFNSQEKRREVWVPQVEADLSLAGVSLVQTREGKKEWVIAAKEARLFENQTADLKAIFVKMETTSGIPVTVSAELGSLDMAGESFVLRQEKNPVLVSWREGFTIETKQLNWSSGKKTIESKGKVKIKAGDKISITGSALKIDLNDSSLSVLGNVHAKIS
ncbi:MAG: LPS export ABC transporter periplasmic protein LptC [Nitrospirota bacterium]